MKPGIFHSIRQYVPVVIIGAVVMGLIGIVMLLMAQFVRMLR
jgi:hypothetical protein